MIDWIRVEDDLPADGIPVLLCIPCKTERYKGNPEYEFYVLCYSGPGEVGIGDATHWAYIQYPKL